MERLIQWISPQWALRRQLSRLAIERLYKAAQPSNKRRNPTDTRSGDTVMDHARGKLWAWSRHLDQNVDLVNSMLSVASYQASQLVIEPTVRLASGELDEDLNDQLRAAWLRYRDRLDAGGTMPWCVLSRLAARTWLRDGECFAQHIMGETSFRDAVPYLVELHEPDLVPFDLVGKSRRTGFNIIHGIEVDRLGRPRAYHLYKEHPGEGVTSAGFDTSTIRIPAEQISHLRNIDRLHQHRGASALAPAITRLADVADYEESEQLAAKTAAAMCAVITRSADWTNTTQATDSSSGERPLELQAGVIFDGMSPGEDVKILGAERPNTGLGDFRKAMLRAACAGFGVSYSAATHDYDGSYSSQRQELVEMKPRYDDLREQYVAMFLRPVWRRFVQALQLANLVRVGPADARTLFDFETIAPPLPWIQPHQEVSADVQRIDAGIESRWGVMRQRGVDPRRVDDERERDTAAPTEPEPEAEGEDEEETETETDDDE